MNLVIVIVMCVVVLSLVRLRLVFPSFRLEALQIVCTENEKEKEEREGGGVKKKKK